MNIVIEIKATEVAQAIQALARAISGNLETIHNRIENAVESGSQIQLAQETQVQQSQPASVTTAPQSQPQAVPTAVPTAPQPLETQPAPQPQVVPTSAPSYTMDQLAVAATQLMDAGKREELVQLLASFGVQALTALPKEQYGAFATKLRELGAKL